jgi:tetratricopeptide (TPR) repeat protein
LSRVATLAICKGNKKRGLSGSPVCYRVTNNVVGIFTAIDDYVHGYALPIQTLLQMFEQDKPNAEQSIKVSEPQETSDTQKMLEEANELMDKKKYYEAIQKYDEIIYDANYGDAVFKKAYAFGTLGRYEEALEWYDKSLTIDPDNSNTLTNKKNAVKNLKKERIQPNDKARST